MKVFLCDLRGDLTTEWTKYFSTGKPPFEYEIHQDSIFNYPADAIVSPANSFGYMDGGVDLAMSNYFGWNIGEKVRDRIQKDYDGELLVGQALNVKTGDEKFPVLISAPTMRVPRRIKNYDDVYLATRAAMRVAVWMELKSITFTGMGSNTGQVPLDKVTKCMYHGICDAIEPPQYPISWYDAQTRMMFITGQV